MRRASTMLLAIVLAFPVASAWSFLGTWEPDTPQDRLGGWMYLEPDTDPGAVPRIYFNAVPFVAGDAPYTTNPLYLWGLRAFVPGADGNRIAPPWSVQFTAIFGAWRDCNQDGYVGLSETGSFRYPVQLMPDPSVCPEGSLFRFEDMVIEYVPIKKSSRADPGEHVILDNGNQTGAWGDFHVPGEGVTTDCGTGTLHRGTTSSTGGLLRVADCEVGHALANAVNEHVDPTGQHGLRFEDPAHPEQSCDSALNIRFSPYGHAYPCEGDRPGLWQRDAPLLATAWDCNNPEGTARLDDPTGQLRGKSVSSPEEVRPHDLVPDLPPSFPETIDPVARITIEAADEEGRMHRVPSTADPVVNPDGSAYGSVRGFFEWSLACGSTTRTTQDLAALGSNALYVSSAIVAQREAPYGPPGPDDGKKGADFPMTYGSTGTTTRDVPWNGVAHTDLVRGYGWHSVGPATTPPHYYGNTIRRDLQPSGAIWFTFYANVGEATRAMLATAATQPAAYGAEACGSHTSGVWRGWDCDPASWWIQPDGRQRAPRGALTVVPGSPYLLRDTDCYDGTLFAGGPQAGLAALSDDPSCPDPRDA